MDVCQVVIDKVNEDVDVPLATEGMERKFIEKLVNKVSKSAPTRSIVNVTNDYELMRVFVLDRRSCQSEM